MYIPTNLYHVMNWDDTQYLLALGREKTLRKAAHPLYVDQAKVGRRIAVLENSVKCQLFTRSNRGYELTIAGHQVFLKLKKWNRLLYLY